MRPRGVPSKWVKVLPWYYTDRRVPSRQQELRDALRDEDAANGDDPRLATFSDQKT